MNNPSKELENDQGLFKRLNIKTVIAIPYKPGVVTNYFNNLNSKNEPQRPKTDNLSD